MRLSLDMSISRGEFLRLLPSAVGIAVTEDANGVFRGGDEQSHWTIRIHPLEDLCLGSVALPRHRMDLSLEGYSKEEATAFLARFQRGFQRGGG